MASPIHRREEQLLLPVENGNVPHSAEDENNFVVQRRIFTQIEFDRYCGINRQVSVGSQASTKSNLRGRARSLFIKKCSCSLLCWKKAIFGVLPVVRWMKDYDVKDNLMSDVIAGLTVAVMNIPQGMAYALLANVDPVYGLYVSFFPVLIYFLMGTSRQVSLGTFAVVSLMIGNIVVDLLATYGMEDVMMKKSNNVTHVNGTMNAVTPPPSAISLAVALAFIIGAFQIGMGVMRLGFVTMYMSRQMLRAFTCGAAIHVFSSQIRHIFGIHLNPAGDAATATSFKLIYFYYEILPKIFSSETNLSAFVISLISLTTMIIVKELVNDKFRARFRIPIPIELIVVIVGTGISYGVKFQHNYDTDIVGMIPTGLPTPSLPPLQLVVSKVGDCFAIAVVSFVIDVSMADLFAKRYSYEVDANQELIALGSANIFGSFFACFPSCASLSRSLVQDGAGGKTQVASIVSAVVILIVLLAIGPLFESLPSAVLASIIVVNLKGMFMQLGDLFHLWNADLLDFLIWSITFSATVLLDVVFGLVIGVGFSLLTVVFRTQSPNAYLLGRIGNTNIYRGMKKYRGCATELKFIKIFRFEAALYFANTEFFKNRLYRLTGVNPTHIICKQHLLDERLRRSDRKKSSSSPAIMQQDMRRNSSFTAAIAAVTAAFTSGSSHDGGLGTSDPDSNIAVPPQLPASSAHLGGTARRIALRQQSENPVSLTDRHVSINSMDSDDDDDDNPYITNGVRCIIIDCSMFGYVDTAGSTTLLQVIGDYSNVGIQVYLVACQEGLLDNLKDQDLSSSLPPDSLHLSIHDAVLYAQAKVIKGRRGRAVDGLVDDDESSVSRSQSPPVVIIDSVGASHTTWGSSQV